MNAHGHRDVGRADSLSAGDVTKHEEASWRSCSFSVVRCQRVDRCVWSTARTNWMDE